MNPKAEINEGLSGHTLLSISEKQVVSPMGNLCDPIDKMTLRFEPTLNARTGLLIGREHIWPMVDGIAMLRIGREKICKAVCSKLRKGDRTGALRLLLNDRDDFDSQPPALISNIDAVIEGVQPNGLLLGETLYLAMRRLNFGPVADYFAIRPSTPTFISGLQLFAQSAGHCNALIDLGCGIGQLSGWIQRCVHMPVVGFDAVFSKLWLARHSYLPDAVLICSDVCHGELPFQSNQGLRTAVLCHDAFYFFNDKRTVLKKARQLAGCDGIVMLGHVHTDRDPHQTGHPQPITEYEKLFQELSDTPWRVVDDSLLTKAAVDEKPLLLGTDFDALQKSHAISACIGNPTPLSVDLQCLQGHHVPNPVLVFKGNSVDVSWPSSSMAREYQEAHYLVTPASGELSPSDRRRRRIELPAEFAIPVDRAALTTAAEISVAVRWAVVGCGWVARDYGVPALLKAKNTILTACVDANPEAIERMRKTLPEAARASIIFEQTINHETLTNVDAVYVATPNHSHAAIVARLAALKKHVLCEKPMTTTVVDAEAMIGSIEESKVRYATALDQRHHPAHIKLRELIVEGQIGTLTQLRIHYACWLPLNWSPDQVSHDNWRVDFRRSGGGAVVDLASHGIDLIEFLTEDKANRITVALQKRVHEYDTCDDGGVVLVETCSGILGSLHLSYACPDALPRRRLEIIGSHGMFQANNTMGQTAGGTVIFIDAGGQQHPVPYANQDVTPFQLQMEAFSDVILNQRNPWNTPRGEFETHRLFLESLKEAEAALAPVSSSGDVSCL